MSENKVVRIVAGYQLMGDVDAREWITSGLDEAVSDGDIDAYDVTGTYPGPYGLRYVTFTVDVTLPHARFRADMTYDEAKVAARHLLAKIVGEDDVELHWVSAAA